MKYYINLHFKTTVLLLSLLFASLYIQAQTSHESTLTSLDSSKMVINYSLNYLADSNNLSIISQEDMILILGHKLSQFLSRNLYFYLLKIKEIDDHVLLSTWLANPNDRPPTPKVRYNVFKNYPINKITYIERIPSYTFIYEESLNKFKWILLDEIDSIMGFQVQKAITKYAGRDWIAWFCPEIPYNDGPYKFCGLPGLIIKIYDTKDHYTFEMKSIDYLQEHINIELPDATFVETSREGFLKAKENFRNDIINRAKEAGLSSEAQQTAARNLQKRNNPIELR